MQEVVRHGSCPTKPNLTTPDFVGELQCRTNSAFRDKDIEFFIMNCKACAKHQKTTQELEFQLHKPPNRPFQRLSMDFFFSFKGHDYLITVDYFSKWFDVSTVTSKTVKAVCQVLEKLFAIFGIPEEVVADNNPFNSTEFQAFANRWDFLITTSSPRYSQSDGLAERFVQTAKLMLKKCEEDNVNLQLALLQAHTTPVEKVGVSPAEILFRLQIRTKVPKSENKLKYQAVDFDEIRDKLENSQIQVEGRQKTRKRVRLNLNDNVIIQDQHYQLSLILDIDGCEEISFP